MSPALPDPDADADDEADDQALGRRAARALAELPDAPASWVAAAIAQWPAGSVPASVVRPAPLDAWLAGLRRVLATLRFDSAAQPALALGMRGGRAATRIGPSGPSTWPSSCQLGPAASGVRRRSRS
jgi:hypothetical protein